MVVLAAAANPHDYFVRVAFAELRIPQHRESFFDDVVQRATQDLVRLLDMKFPSSCGSQEVRILLRVPVRQIQCSLDFKRLSLVLRDLESKTEFR